MKLNKNILLKYLPSLKLLKKIGVYFLSIIVLFVIVSSLNVYVPKVIDSFDSKVRDQMFILRGEQNTTGSVVIVDIDEKALATLGQWPWPRHQFAKILENLTLGGIGVIGLDVVFAEEDQSSPAKVFASQGYTDVQVPDYDEYLNYIVQNTPTILGYQFQLSEDRFAKQDPLDIPAIIIENNKQEGQNLLIKAKGTILNHKSLQQSAYSSGFFNNIPDESGVIRSVPLVLSYDNQLYPSLALEIFRASMGVDDVYINYSDLGIENIQIKDFIIPTDRYGRFIINFRGPSRTFEYISALDVYNGNFDPKFFEGKVALIGTTAAGLHDLRAIPFESVYPGVEVHANIIDNILDKNFLYLPTWIDGLNMLFIFIAIFLTVYLTAFLPLWLNPFIIFAMMGGYVWLTYVVLFEYHIVLNIVLPLIGVVLATIFTTLISYIFEIKKEQAIKNKFASKVSLEVMESLIDVDNNKFHAMKKDVTIFFSDVRNFTMISESMKDPQLLIEFLNEYMDPMTQIIIEEKGTVDKFIGDAVMAYWNAPADVENHADAALRASLKQLYEVQNLNKIIKQDERFIDLVHMAESQDIEPIDIGIGLNSGEVIVGEMGSTQRSDYTIIGDPVNLGSRLESLCKFYGSRLNISNFTKEHLKDHYIMRCLDIVTVKGQSRPVQIWQVIDFDRDEDVHTLYDTTRERLDEEIFTHHRALDLYQNSFFDEALELFEELESRIDKTNDKLYKIYIQRCHEYIENPPENFDGVYRHSSK